MTSILYGKCYRKSYSTEDDTLGRLVREILIRAVAHIFQIPDLMFCLPPLNLITLTCILITLQMKHTVTSHNLPFSSSLFSSLALIMSRKKSAGLSCCSHTSPTGRGGQTQGKLSPNYSYKIVGWASHVVRLSA